MSDQRKTMVLALDLATVTGFAHSGGVSGSVDFSLRRGESPGMKFFEFRNWLQRFLYEHPTQIIVYEQSGHQRSNAATHSAHGLIATLELVATEKSIELTNRSPSEIKIHALPEIPGRERTKPRMIQAADNKWPGIDFVDDNHADALHLLDLVELQLGLDYGQYEDRPEMFRSLSGCD